MPCAAIEMLRRGIAIQEICEQLGRTRAVAGQVAPAFRSRGRVGLRGHARAPCRRPRTTPEHTVRGARRARSPVASPRTTPRFAGIGADAVAWELEL